MSEGEIATVLTCAVFSLTFIGFYKAFKSIERLFIELGRLEKRVNKIDGYRP